MVKSKDEILRERILEGASGLFRERGMCKTTMEDIARAVGKGKSTLYYYFKSKEDIFDAIVQEDKRRFFVDLQEALAKVSTAEQKLNVFVKTKLDKIRHMTTFYKVLMDEIREALAEGGDASLMNYRKQHDEKGMSIVKSIVQFGIITGEFRVLEEEEIEMISHLLVSVCHGFAQEIIMGDKIEHLACRTDLMTDIFLNGIKKTEVMADLTTGV